MNLHKWFANGVYTSLLLIHLVLIHVVMAFAFDEDSSIWWGIPFALGYAFFIGLTMGLVYHYILPKKSKKYWED
ncbi:MAG: hypothetical protein DRQ98_11890 [Gammaproteobacteria bacterium]|nr:MAG: hypothetical protein DRQ98_11890 [Gammaproteobacteria bacterium]